MRPLSSKHIDTLMRGLSYLKVKAEALRDVLYRYTARDTQLIFIILFLAILLRFPFIAYPAYTEFDEVIYSNFAMLTMQGHPFFDIHPPLARMIFAEIIRLCSPFTTIIQIANNQPFGDFPYVLLRYAVACFGVLLPLIIYAIARILKYSPRAAALPALFIVCDNAFVIYSRTILPDTLLLVLNFLGFGAALWAMRAKEKWHEWALIIAAGIFLGLALSIKWTALGVLATVWVLLVYFRKYMAILATAFLAALVYVVIFISFFFYFPTGGAADPLIKAMDHPWVRSLEFPKTGSHESLGEEMRFFVTLHEAMLHANKDPEVIKETLKAAGPLSWSTAKAGIIFWIGADGKMIKLSGNTFLWIISFFVLLFEVGWIIAMCSTRVLAAGGITKLLVPDPGKNKIISLMQKWKALWPIGVEETILLIGYAMNYLPFFLIGRPMFLYHYFTAIIFLFLLMPKVSPRIIDCLARLSRDKLFAYTLVYSALFLIFVNFFLTLSTTYGF